MVGGCGACGERVRVVPGMVGTATGMALKLKWAIYHKLSSTRQGDVTYETVSEANEAIDAAFGSDRTHYEVRSIWV